ncbi:hypothetical protein [uncultured Bradyrhizobium sp.]|jgi:hypothetical protein|uniref:hypothetical protein n=1 Tax=uncultured Bradyrhizobium sp. TaxID=199684 RepID=UPI0026306EE6|nr:hypothetical protein [uncultured Bradyrhizobium sp.]
MTGAADEVDPFGLFLDAHHLAGVVAEQVKALGFDRTHLAHGLITEAMTQLLDVDLFRADTMARGFIALAVADQAQFEKDKQSDVIDRAIRGDLRNGSDLGACVLNANKEDRARLVKGSMRIRVMP